MGKRVWGPGFRVQGSGDSGLRVEGCTVDTTRSLAIDIHVMATSELLIRSSATFLCSVRSSSSLQARQSVFTMQKSLSGPPKLLRHARAPTAIASVDVEMMGSRLDLVHVLCIGRTVQSKQRSWVFSTLKPKPLTLNPQPR